MLNDFLIGHNTDSENGTGVTVILCPEGAIGGVSVRGSAPATRETDLLRPGNSVEKANAIVLSGGSAFGLDAAGGVMRYLDEKGVGYPTGAKPVPIVAGASLYDLEYRACAYPDRESGYCACLIARAERFESGAIGAGTGATVGKIMGALSADKSGLGVAVMTLADGVEIGAVVAVNAFGDIYDYKDGSRVGGASMHGNAIDILDQMRQGAKFLTDASNTTIGCVFTDAKLTKEQANKLADIAHDGYAMTIRPVHTMVDGDAVFALASGRKECNFMLLSSLVPTLVAEAILQAVRSVKE